MINDETVVTSTNEEVVVVTDLSKLAKTRTSLTLTPSVFEWAKGEALVRKTSVSQLIEDLLVALKNGSVSV